MEDLQLNVLAGLVDEASNNLKAHDAKRSALSIRYNTLKEALAAVQNQISLKTASEPSSHVEVTGSLTVHHRDGTVKDSVPDRITTILKGLEFAKRVTHSEIAKELKDRWPEYAERSNKSINVASSMGNMRGKELDWLGYEQNEKGQYSYWNKKAVTSRQETD